MIRATLLALLSFGAVPAPSLAAAPAADQPGDGFEVSRYRLALSPDIATRTVAGRETITLRATGEDVWRLVFSGNALIIDRATLDGVPLAHGMRGGLHGFDLPRPLRRGQSVTLDLSYHGRPARGFAGSASALHTSYFACDWMICAQDKVGEKAAFSLALRVPAGMTSLSVGRRVARQAEPAGSEIHRWESPRPYSAYLYGFAVGRFTQVAETVGSRRLVYLGDGIDAAELARRFSGTGATAAFLSAKAGLPLPVADYAQLLVAGSEAQEAASYSVLGTKMLPAQAGDPVEDWAIAHELAHQWWGNLVTCATLRDFWLNEGITTFMTAAWKEHRYGRAAYDAELAVARTRLDRARAAGFDKPLAWDGNYPTLGMRRAVQYSKGALFMALLRETLGETACWSGLRRYTRRHAGRTVTSIDLQHAMEAVSGRDLHPLFAEWVFG